MTIDKQKLLQWIEDEKFVFSGPYDASESSDNILRYQGRLLQLSKLERAIELGEFKQE